MMGPIAIAISAFRSDAAVITLLEAIFAAPHPEVDVVIVVESLGTGEIVSTAKARNWRILYENSNVNLGSAGNLARRMEIAAQVGADWCLCLNHDAYWDPSRLSAMLSTARSLSQIGAVYPILDHSPRSPRWEDGRRDFVPSAGTRVNVLPADDSNPQVLWSSSNGALYATEPLADEVFVMSNLWMGYEDLAYGIALYKSGWIQLMCRSAVVTQIFDYECRWFFGRKYIIPAKPAWYSYYNIRNLCLIRHRYGADTIPINYIVGKFLQSSLRIIALENQKTTRLSLLVSGAIDGVLGRSGKGRQP